MQQPDTNQPSLVKARLDSVYQLDPAPPPPKLPPPPLNPPLLDEDSPPLPPLRPLSSKLSQKNKTSRQSIVQWAPAFE
jgi:hypothetical protein